MNSAGKDILKKIKLIISIFRLQSTFSGYNKKLPNQVERLCRLGRSIHMIKEKKRKENAEIKEYKLKYITTIIRGVLVLLVICFTQSIFGSFAAAVIVVPVLIKSPGINNAI